MEIAAGTVIGGYEIRELLGSGGQSAVYRAEDVALRRPAAIKILAEETLGDELSRRRFLLEARALSSLQHPHIATIYQIGEQEGKPFIAMEFVPGEPLHRHLAGRALPLSERIGLMAQIAEAVGYAHRLGILHRDLKPANILVSGDGQVKLVDFGLAKLAGGDLQVKLGVGDNLTETGTVVGTVSYLSPEQAQGESVDSRSDLFALGVIFYEMLAGRRPFDRETPMASLMALLHDPPSPLDPALPPGVRAAVERLLAKDPADRYPSADLLASDLREWEAGRPVTPPAGSALPAAATRRRWRLLAAACVVLAALAGAGLWLRFRPVPAPAGPSPDSRVTVLVLPIAGGPDERGRYLAGLVTGELIATLDQSPGMRILHVPGESAGRAEALREKLLREQPVRYVVAGRLVLDGEALRVSLQLSRHPDAVVLWSDTIRGGVSDIFDIPGRVAAEVGRTAGAYVAAERLAFPGREAFEHYTRGDILYQTYDAARLEESIAEFERSIAAAPDFLPAYEKLARCLLQYHNLGLDDNPAHLDRARQVLEEGLSRRPDAPRLLAARSWLEMYTYDVARALQTLQPVLAGGSATGSDYKLMSFLCLMQGDPRRAEGWLQRAIDLDPLDVNAGMNRVRIHSLAGPASALEADLEAMRGLYPPPLILGIVSGWERLGQGDPAGAVRIYEQSYRRQPARLALEFLMMSEFQAGEYDAALRHCDELQETNPYLLEGYMLEAFCLGRLGRAAERAAAARDGARYAALWRRYVDNQVIRLFEAYFQAVAGDFRGGPGEIARIDTAAADTFTRYLQAAVLAHLGRPEALAAAPDPYSQVYWITLLARAEKESFGRQAPAEVGPDRSGR
jgi:serine/threonine-protein kinase